MPLHSLLESSPIPNFPEHHHSSFRKVHKQNFSHHFLATFQSWTGCVQATIVHKTLAHIFFLTTNFPILFLRHQANLKLLRKRLPWKREPVLIQKTFGLWPHAKTWFKKVTTGPVDFSRLYSWGPTPRPGLGGWKLVWSTFSKLFTLVSP